MDADDVFVATVITIFATFFLAFLFALIYGLYTDSQVSKKCWNMPYEEYAKDTRCKNVIERNS